VFYRTDRTITVAGEPSSALEVRSYTEAESASEARVLSRQEALDAVHSGRKKEIVGLETVIEVPGVTSARPSEIQTDGKWRPVEMN
jgi:hypothetical protein